MRQIVLIVAVSAGLLAAHGTVATAQRGGGETTAVRPGARAGRRGLLPPDRATQNLAREIRLAFAQVVRRQLGLNDEQAKRLADIDRKFQLQRDVIGRDERDARVSLRTLLEDTTATPDAAKVDDYVSRLIKAQRKRADVLEAEQKELAAFLSPVQRAKLLALREQLQRRIQELRQDGRGRRGGPPPER